MNELALFAGAGGGILGGHLLGWRTVCAVERDAYAAQVLAQRQNDGALRAFPIWSDVCSFDGRPWRGLIDVVSGGSLAKTSAQLGKEQAWLARDRGYGEKWRESLAKFDPVTSSWRTAQFSLLGGLESFSETWPRWGSMLNGASYLLPTPALITYGSESGLWPTPVASDTGSRKKPYAQGGTPLSLAVKLYPTPTTMKASGGAALCKWGGAGARKKMASMVTPSELNGPLNPPWVEWLMGWPIGWSDLTPLAMDKFHEWQQQHGACLPTPPSPNERKD